MEFQILTCSLIVFRARMLVFLGYRKVSQKAVIHVQAYFGRQQRQSGQKGQNISLWRYVKALCSKKFMPDFQKWLDFLSEQGYSNKWQVLNAKKYGIPQNRERVFCVSVLGDDTYQFPEPFELKKHIKDILENPITQDTFYNEDYLHNLHWFDNSGKHHNNDGIIKLGNVFQSNHSSGTIYDINGCCGTIMLHHGTGTLVGIPDGDGGYKVKKLSSREMFRCMGVDDNDIDNMIGAVGKTAAWKLAGNSIVVDVLYHIFKTMFIK